jgi:pimeloyl-ACP methyl ester carboxylesterase
MGIGTFPSAGLLMFWGGLQNDFWAFSHNPTEYAKYINCPTLLLYGEADNRVSRTEIDEIYNNLTCKKQLVTYPLSGHEDYLIKYHDKWVADVSAFMNGN